MSPALTRRRLAKAALCGMLLLASAQPAYAQAAGGNLGTFIQMPADRLLVLRAGLAPVRGRKIVYWRELAFRARVLSPPVVPPHPAIVQAMPQGSAASAMRIAPTTSAQDSLTLDLIVPALAAAGLEPLPAEGATDEEVEAWVGRFIDGAVHAPDLEFEHA